MSLWLYLAALYAHLFLQPFAPYLSLIPLALTLVQRGWWAFVFFSFIVLKLSVDDTYLYFTTINALYGFLYIMIHGKDIFLYPPYFVAISNSVFLMGSIALYTTHNPVWVFLIVTSETLTFLRSKYPIEGLTPDFLRQMVVHRVQYTATTLYVFVTLSAQILYAVSVCAFLLLYVLQKNQSINSCPE